MHIIPIGRIGVLCRLGKETGDWKYWCFKSGLGLEDRRRKIGRDVCSITGKSKTCMVECHLCDLTLSCHSSSSHHRVFLPSQRHCHCPSSHEGASIPNARTPSLTFQNPYSIESSITGISHTPKPHPKPPPSPSPPHSVPLPSLPTPSPPPPNP